MGRGCNEIKHTKGVEGSSRCGAVCGGARLLCGGTASRDASGTVGGSAATLKDARKFLEGRWGLESFELRPAGKPPIVLKGSGALEYDDFGNLRMEIRADEASSDLLRAAGVNIRDGIISTQGRTAI